MILNNVQGQLAKDLLIRIGIGLEKNDLTLKELPYVAGFILSNIDFLYSDDERYAFLIQLTRKWPWLEGIAVTHLTSIENPDSVRSQIELLAKGIQLIGASH